MTKAELQERTFKLNCCVTTALATFEAIAEAMPEKKIGMMCAAVAELIRDQAGDAWIDGEKQ